MELAAGKNCGNGSDEEVLAAHWGLDIRESCEVELCRAAGCEVLLW